MKKLVITFALALTTTVNMAFATPSYDLLGDNIAMDIGVYKTTQTMVAGLPVQEGSIGDVANYTLEQVKNVTSFGGQFLKGYAELGIKNFLDLPVSVAQKSFESLSVLKAATTSFLAYNFVSTDMADLRDQYNQRVGGLKDMVIQFEGAGLDKKSIAQALHQERRTIGEEFKGLTSLPSRLLIYARNFWAYRDTLGPSFDYLAGKYKKKLHLESCSMDMPCAEGIYDAIIEASTRTGGDDLGLKQFKKGA